MIPKEDLFDTRTYYGRAFGKEQFAMWDKRAGLFVYLVPMWGTKQIMTLAYGDEGFRPLTVAIPRAGKIIPEKA